MNLLSLLCIAVSLSAVLGASLRVARDGAVAGSESAAESSCAANSTVLGNSTDLNTTLQQMTVPQETCSEWKAYGSGSGVYTISPTGGCEFKVFCDMCLEQRDGWIVIQRRESDEVAFHHMGWEDYKKGFGDYRYNYWIGLEKLHQITSSGSYELFVGLYDKYSSNPHRLAVYGTFEVASESQNYKLTVDNYDSGRSNLTDSLIDQHNGRDFTTHEDDHDNDDNDDRNCAHHGGLYYGGWWFGGSDCLDANLNGQYFTDGNNNPANGILWEGLNSHSMTTAIMAIRRL